VEALTEEPRPTGWHRLLVEPRRPAGVRERPSAYWFAVAAVCIGAFMGQLDASIVTVALPTLQRAFGASVGSVTWVGLSYLLVLVATVAAVGRFADMVGRKLLYVYGFLIFVAGSALCGAAQSLGALDGSRAVQAIGAAMLQANSVAIITLAVPRRSLGKAIGVQGASQALGLALGPSVGGLLLAAGGWRLIFLVNVPFGLIGTAAGLVFIPRSRQLEERVRFDWTGLSLFIPSVGCLLAAIASPGRGGWVERLALGGVAAVLAVAFLVRERRTDAPMVDLDLFKRRPFSVGMGAALLSYMVMFGVLLLVPFYLERALGARPGLAGAELMVMPLALGIAATIAGRVADRVGSTPLTVAGMATTAVGLVVMALTRPSTPAFLLLLAVVGLGLGVFMAPNNASVMSSAPPRQAGAASGLLNMTRGMGTAMGLALTALVFAGAGGESGSSAAATAFTVAAVTLAVAATLSAVVSSLRPAGHDAGGGAESS
jgi:EmrB/QacA subfamily drug resistance transporter